MAISSVLAAIESHLTHELGDATIAHELANALREDVLAWRAPEIDVTKIKTILAFTFGNRLLRNGNRSPGPVNEALADVAARLYRQTGAPLYAQWEVAEAVGTRIPANMVTAIFPNRDERAEPVYLSTSDVVSAVVQGAADRHSFGVVGVVGFADHLWRCVATARRFGLDAYGPSGYTMPSEYDAQSGQPWCRGRLPYLMHDIMIRASERRGRLTSQSGS